MNPDYQNQPAYDPKQRVGNTLAVTQPGEVTICSIKRHPIGLVGIYVMCGFLLLVVAVLAFGVAPHLSSDSSNHSSITQVGAVVLLLLAIICALYSFVATKVYWGNTWVVTSDSITQITQTSLFNRQSSQLSLGNLEDVTAEQNGILTHMLNYGLLKVETAGERSKFQFGYCPNPNYYAQQILAAREAFEQGRQAQEPEQRLYREQGSYAPAPQAAAPPTVNPYSPPPPPTMQPPTDPTGGTVPVYPPYSPTPTPQPPTTAYPNGSVDPGVNTGTE